MPHVKPAYDFLEKVAPIWRDALAPKSLLYIGWRYDGRPWWYDKFGPALGIEKFGVLEIFPKNLADFELQVWAGRYDAQGFLGDARKIEEVPGDWDVIYWDHGPEHVSYEDLNACTPKLHARANKLLLYSVPWGEWPQGMEDGNEHEVHRNSVYSEQLKDLGMEVVSFGGPSQQMEGELAAWKFK